MKKLLFLGVLAATIVGTVLAQYFGGVIQLNPSTGGVTITNSVGVVGHMTVTDYINAGHQFQINDLWAIDGQTTNLFLNPSNQWSVIKLGTNVIVTGSLTVNGALNGLVSVSPAIYDAPTKTISVQPVSTTDNGYMLATDYIRLVYTNANNIFTGSNTISYPFLTLSNGTMIVQTKANEIALTNGNLLLPTNAFGRVVWGQTTNASLAYVTTDPGPGEQGFVVYIGPNPRFWVDSSGHMHKPAGRTFFLGGATGAGLSDDSGNILISSGAGLTFGSASAGFPMLIRTNGHLKLVNGLLSNSATNGFFFQATTNAVAATAATINQQSGRVRISSGSQSYFVTNSLVTVFSIVLATVNSDDATASAAKAIPSAGLLTLKLNGVAAADADISWFIVTP